MTIEVSGPGGVSIEFPDGTDAATINGVMAQHFGGTSGSGGPAFGSDEYVKSLARKHDVDPEYVRGIIHSQPSGEVLKGTPVLGAFVDQAGAGLGAARDYGVAAVKNLFTGSGPGASIGERYEKNLPLRREIAADYERENPGTTTAARIIGGITTTGALGGTSLGAPFLGAVEGGLGRQIAASTASGAGLGYLDALARGEDTTKAAEIGGVAGGFGPAIGRIAGTGLQGVARVLRGGTPPVMPQNISRIAGVDVPLSSGQATGDVSTQMMENTALRGGEGQAPQRVAEQFFRGEQAPAVEQARANIGRGFDRYGGQSIVESPQEAGELVGDSIRNIAAASRRNYQDLYAEALGLPGEIHAAAFEGIGQRIKGALSNRQSPVIIDDVTTPIASRALQDIDNTISHLRIQNRAAPGGQPNPENIIGVSLRGVDQVRKRLNAFAQSTERGSADQRAVRAVIDEFDNRVEDAISNRMFTGDDRALDALREARAAYSQHRRLFTSQGAGDDVGRTMERIVGRNGGEGATPTEIANWLYGSARVGGTGLSVRLGQHMQQVLGADSPEWAGLRQGLWARLTAATDGTTQMGPGRIANRIGEFLNGSGAPLAQAMFSPQERRLMENFAALQRQLEPRPGTVNTSNTAPVLRMLAINAMRTVMAAIGASVAGPAGTFAAVAGRPMVERLAERSAAGRVARSLYQTPAQQRAESALGERAGRFGALASRALAPPLVNRWGQP